MCGISGFNWKDEKKVRQMMSALSHRGPDAEGSHCAEGISFGHNRLSIIDLSREANQPMWDAQRELVIVYNGEIYNFQELKNELAAEYPFKTKSDTEVILAGYRKWGRSVAERLNGMFAFALWDRRDRSLFCARDHAGMKPFYYFWDGARFIFASEIPAILTHDIPRALNGEAFQHYLRVLYAPEPLTMIKGVFKLPPAHTLILKGERLGIESYRSEIPLAEKIPYAHATALVREKTLRAVERHLISDVPLGVYLSGGIDSSVVLAAMAKVRANIKTFSVGFALEEEEEAEKFNSDFALARESASFFGTDHHSVIVSEKDVLNAMEKVAAHNSDPVSNPTALPMYLLAKHARKDVTVVLTGNGGDELFGGYQRYRLALLARLYARLPRALRASLSRHPSLAKLEYEGAIDLFARFMFEKDEKLSRVIARDVFKDDSFGKAYFQKYMSAGNDPAAALMSADERSWLPDYFFMLSDKMSMAEGLEERMPLVDLELKSFGHSLPRSHKVDLFRTKKILKDAFRGDLPPHLFGQPKRGWFSPAAKWLRRADFSRFARNVLSQSYYEGTADLFRWNALTEMLERHLARKEYNPTLLWALLTFQMWARAHSIKP